MACPGKAANCKHVCVCVFFCLDPQTTRKTGSSSTIIVWRSPIFKGMVWVQVVFSQGHGAGLRLVTSVDQHDPDGVPSICLRICFMFLCWFWKSITTGTRTMFSSGLKQMQVSDEACFVPSIGHGISTNRELMFLRGSIAFIVRVCKFAFHLKPLPSVTSGKRRPDARLKITSGYPPNYYGSAKGPTHQEESRLSTRGRCTNPC